MADSQPVEPTNETPTTDPAPAFVPASQVPRPAKPPESPRNWREPKPVLMPQVDHMAKLHFGRLQPGPSVFQWYLAKIPAGVAADTLLNPSYWGHFARQLRELDVIRAVADDGRWEGLFTVMARTNSEARLATLLYVEHDDSALAEPGSDAYDVKWVSPPLKYGVVNKKTGERLESGFPTKADAYRWLADHAKRMAR